MQKANGYLRAPLWKILASFVLYASFVLVNSPALAQDPSQTTVTGTVVSYTNNVIVIKTEDRRYSIFVFDRNSSKPKTLAVGDGVRVVSTQTDDPEVRLAVAVVPFKVEASPTAAPSSEPDVVPVGVRKTERAIEKQAKRIHFGLQGGMALDPELVDIGILAKFGPFFSKNLQFRPSLDFAYGQVTKLFALNGDVIYNLSTNLGARRNLYFGAGPQFNFSEQSLNSHGVDFSDFRYSTALNVILGVQFRSGVFTEMKTSIYASPAPIYRLMVGYTF
jgi:hypothetical protein